MVIIVKVVFSGVDALSFVLNKCHATGYHFVVTVLVPFSCFFSDLLHAFDQAVVVAVWVVGDDPHPAVNLDDLFPMGQLSRPVVLNCFEFVGVAVTTFEFVRAMFVEVPDFFDS